MPEVITFLRYRPPERYDSLPWTEVRIEEAATEDGTYTQIDVIALSPLDADPADPAYRSFTTENGTAEDLWYRISFADADGDTTVPTAPIQNTTTDTTTVTAYATLDELQRILKIRTPTTEQEAAMERVLLVAAGEIDAEIDLATGADLSGWQLALAEEVNLERAVEHWHQLPVAFGIIGLDSEAPMRLARDTWERHAHKLAPLKGQWGMA